ncbi:MAG: DUF1573 domain-containing protein [Gemmatales bacterium]
MFRLGLVFSLALLSHTYLVAAETNVLNFEEPVKDLGGAPRGTKLVHHFKFTNASQQPVHISGVRTSCHCSTAHAMKQEIAPGESSSIMVEVNTILYSGTRDFTIYVNYDRPVVTENRLMLKTVSREDLSISPNSLNFGTIKLGSAPSMSVVLDNRSMTGWKITGIENENGYIQANVEPNGTNGNSYRLTVRLREDTPAGYWHASLGLVTNDPTTPRIQVPLSVEIQGLLAVTPSTLNMGKLNGDTMEKKIVVRGAKPFKITGIEGLDNILSIDQTKTDEAKMAHVLKITYSGKADAGELLKKIKIKTDLDNTTVELPVQGQVVK